LANGALEDRILRDILLVAMFCAVILPALTRPWLGVLIWACFEYMNPHRLTFGFAYNLPFAYISAIVTVIGVVLSGGPKRFPFTRETILLMLFSIWMTFTTFFALNPEAAWLGWNRAIKIQIFIFAVLLIIKTPKRLHTLIWVIAVSIGFYAIKGGLFTLLTGGGDMVRGPAASFIEDNNDLALAVATIIPLLRYLQLTTERRWVRLGLGGAMALSIVSVVGSYSRAGLLALATVLVLMILRSRRRIILSCVLAASMVLTLSFMPQKWFDRMNTIQNYQNDGSAIGRLNAWGFAWNIAQDHPITGGGFQAFTTELFQQYAPDPENVHEAHNIFLKVMAEHGFPGLLLFLALGFYTWRSMVWIRRRTRDDPASLWASDLVAMVQVSLAGYAVGGAFSNLSYFDLPYNLMAIIVICKVYLRDNPITEEDAPDREPEVEALPNHLAAVEETQ
jgi:probable O-glycosylation ligase (exosortase A-associated)